MLTAPRSSPVLDKSPVQCAGAWACTIIISLVDLVISRLDIFSIYRSVMTVQSNTDLSGSSAERVYARYIGKHGKSIHGNSVCMINRSTVN